MTEQTSAVTDTTNARIVERFLFALADQDFAAADALLADDVAYQNVGLPTIHGRTRVVKLLSGMEGRAGFEVAFHRNVAQGSTVINERTDALVVGRLRVQFWVCGVFEVHGGRITLWRDYFDFYAFTREFLRGVAGIAIPALRRSF